jgi:aminoglycoside phosphotransferase (APT) family kinase protein
VHGLLRHLEAVDFPAPRVLHTDTEVEVLTWIVGDSGADGWAKVVPESGLRRWAWFLREYHDAVAGYRPPAQSVWASGTGTCGAGEIICHGDFGPWNAVWRGHEVVGLIDWDMARPARPLFDIAYGLEYVVPFREDEECVRWLRYPGPPDRRRRTEIFLDACGMPAPAKVAACVAEQQRMVAATCEDLGGSGIEPQATWIRQGHYEQLQSRIRWTESLDL